MCKVCGKDAGYMAVGFERSKRLDLNPYDGICKGCGSVLVSAPHGFIVVKERYVSKEDRAKKPVWAGLKYLDLRDKSNDRG